MAVNNATILGGPALVQFKGATFYSKGNITLTNNKQTFNIDTDRFGKVDERVSDEELKVSFEPAGEFENLSVLWPYASTALGSLITPQSQAVSALNTTSDQLTVTGHGLSTGAAVLVHMSTGGTLPAASPSLSQTTTYYVRAVDANTLQLHDTEAHASANTDKVNFSDSGTGTLYIDADYACVIHTFSGVKLTLYNAAVTRMPSLNLSAVKTIIGAVELEAFVKNGVDITAAGSRWAISNTALSDTSFDPANILTQAYTAAWGSSPWDSFQTKDGFVVDFNLGLEAVMTDALGTRTRRLSSLEVTARGTPAGIDENQLLTKLLLQDTGSGRGRSLSGSNLLISGAGSNAYVQLYGAALKQAGMNFSAGLERMAELTWFATRTFATGTPNPLFYVGATAPA
jgi:hypothetical protein